jgi:hypothetical protein
MYKKIKIELNNFEPSQENKDIIFGGISDGRLTGSIGEGFDTIEWSLESRKLRYSQVINQKRITNPQIESLLDSIFPTEKHGKDQEYVISEMEDSHLLNSIVLMEKKLEISELKEEFIEELGDLIRNNKQILTYFALIKEIGNRGDLAKGFIFDTESD